MGIPCLGISGIVFVLFKEMVFISKSNDLT